jgi:hypothetical protein
VQTRAEQDNEQWHLLILQDLVQRRPQAVVRPCTGRGQEGFTGRATDNGLRRGFEDGERLAIGPQAPPQPLGLDL